MKIKKHFLTIQTLLLLCIMVPLLTVTFLITIRSLSFIRETANIETEAMLTASGESLKYYCEYVYSNTGKLPQDYNYIDSLKNKHVDLTIYDYNVSLASSIKEGDNRLEGIEVSEEIKDVVLNKGVSVYLDDILINGEKYCGYYTPIIHEDSIVGIAFSSEPYRLIEDTLETSINKILILCVILILLFLVAGILFAHIVSKPLKIAAEYLLALSDKNLTIDKISCRSLIKETVAIFESASTLHDSFKEVISELNSESNSLNKTAAKSIEDTKIINSNIQQISTAVSELASSSSSMAESVQDVNNQIIEVGDSISNIRTTTDNLSQLSETMLNVNRLTSDAITTVFENNDKTVKTIEDVAAQINSSYNSIQEITNAVDLITNIAKQTNLLALNAAIEAARAGEAGKGFAVVADSIQSLSEQSTEGANSIRQLVTSILVQSVNSVEATNSAVKLIKSGQDTINSTMVSFEELNQSISDASSAVANLQDMIVKLDSTKEVILSSVNDLSAVSEENAASSQEMTASLDTIVQAMSDLDKVINVLNTLSVNTNNIVNGFTV